MSLLPDLRYNIQSHGWDYNIGVHNYTLVPAASPQYTWQLSTCASDSSRAVYVADTASRSCLVGDAAGGAVGTKPCERGDGVWGVVDEGRNTYTIRLVVDVDGGVEEAYLFLDDEVFGLGGYAAGSSKSDFQWAFRAGDAEGVGAWDVCEYVTVVATGSG